MSALQLWLQNHKRTLTQAAIDEALMEYIAHVEKQRDELLADVAEEAAVREKLANLLAETAVALKGPEAALFRHSWHDLADVAAGVVKQRDDLLASEHKLSDAYIRLREKLSAFDTPTAPTAEQVYAHTEAKLDCLIEQRDGMLATLDDVKIYLQDTQAQRHIYDRVIKAIASVKGGAA